MNHLEQIEEIIKKLRSQDQTEIAEKVQEAVRAAGTGTELIMGVRFYLRQLPINQVDAETRDDIINLIKKIDNFLK